jgi:NAD-dependent deacetylase
VSVVFFTGAGISTDSGIPDYRGPNGLWRRDPDAAKLVTYDSYVNDAALRRRSWLFRRESHAWSAEPNPAHKAIAACPDSWVVTQNVDRLHLRAGTPPQRLLELHGNVVETVCIACAERTATRDAIERVLAGEDDPRCIACGGILKTATVMFGESLDPDVLGRAVDLARGASTFVAVGSTLQVQPAASLVGIAVHWGARLIIVNNQPTPYDERAAHIIRDPISTASPALCTSDGWLDSGS